MKRLVAAASPELFQVAQPPLALNARMGVSATRGGAAALATALTASRPNTSAAAVAGCCDKKTWAGSGLGLKASPALSAYGLGLPAKSNCGCAGGTPGSPFTGLGVSEPGPSLKATSLGAKRLVAESDVADVGMPVGSVILGKDRVWAQGLLKDAYGDASRVGVLPATSLSEWWETRSVSKAATSWPKRQVAKSDLADLGTLDAAATPGKDRGWEQGLLSQPPSRIEILFGGPLGEVPPREDPNRPSAFPWLASSVVSESDEDDPQCEMSTPAPALPSAGLDAGIAGLEESLEAGVLSQQLSLKVLSNPSKSNCECAGAASGSPFADWAGSMRGASVKAAALGAKRRVAESDVADLGAPDASVTPGKDRGWAQGLLKDAHGDASRVGVIRATALSEPWERRGLTEDFQGGNAVYIRRQLPSRIEILFGGPLGEARPPKKPNGPRAFPWLASSVLSESERQREVAQFQEGSLEAGALGQSFSLKGLTSPALFERTRTLLSSSTDGTGGRPPIHHPYPYAWVPRLGRPPIVGDLGVSYDNLPRVPIFVRCHLVIPKALGQGGDDTIPAQFAAAIPFIESVYAGVPLRLLFDVENDVSYPEDPALLFWCSSDDGFVDQRGQPCTKTVLFGPFKTNVPTCDDGAKSVAARVDYVNSLPALKGKMVFVFRQGLKRSSKSDKSCTWKPRGGEARFEWPHIEVGGVGDWNLAHEIGHFFGLQHSRSADSVESLGDLAKKVSDYISDPAHAGEDFQKTALAQFDPDTRYVEDTPPYPQWYASMRGLTMCQLVGDAGLDFEIPQFGGEWPPPLIPFRLQPDITNIMAYASDAIHDGKCAAMTVTRGQVERIRKVLTIPGQDPDRTAVYVASNS